MTERGACGSCGAPAGRTQNFCTRCGVPVQEDLGAPASPGERRERREPAGAAEPDKASAPHEPAAPDEPSAPETGPAITACPRCGAVNAASRRRCGRCDGPLHEGDALARAAGRAGAVPAHPNAPPPPAVAPAERDSSGALVLATVLATLVVAVVAASLLQQRDTAEGVPAPSEQRVVTEVAAVSASSWLPATESATYGPRNLIDGDTSTAWNEAAEGSGRGEWVELRLGSPSEVTRLVIWNGHQQGELFSDNARVRTLRIELGTASFTAQLLDARGPQAVDLPQPVSGDRVRLTIQDVYPGVRYDDGALSEVEVQALETP